MHEKLLESKETFPKAPISDDLKSLKVCRCPPASVSGSFTYTQLLFDQRVKNNIGAHVLPLFLYNIYNISRVRRAAITTACSSLTPAGWNECGAHVCTLEFRHDCLDSDFPDTVETIWGRKNRWDLGEKKKNLQQHAGLFGKQCWSFTSSSKTALRSASLHYVDEIPVKWAVRRLKTAARTNQPSKSLCGRDSSSLFPAYSPHFSTKSSKERDHCWLMRHPLFRWQHETRKRWDSRYTVFMDLVNY